MTENDLKLHSSEKGQHEHSTLLKLHEFYTKDAQHQRSMMWDTVKWFTPILIGVHSFWFYLYKENFNLNWLLILSLSGALFTLICFKLLCSFYKTNLIYISMLIKVEDDLNFLIRKSNRFFPKDKEITYQAYLNDRRDYRTAEDFVKTTLIKGSMHHSMQFVFCLFFAGFLGELYIVFWKQGYIKTMEIWSNIFSIVVGLIGAYCLSFSLKISTQYSKELVKELKLDEENYTIPTNVSQREGLFWWGIALITLASLVQMFLAIAKAGLLY
jgi:hypothetical protein